MHPSRSLRRYALWLASSLLLLGAIALWQSSRPAPGGFEPAVEEGPLRLSLGAFVVSIASAPDDELPVGSLMHVQGPTGAIAPRLVPVASIDGAPVRMATYDARVEDGEIRVRASLAAPSGELHGQLIYAPLSDHRGVRLGWRASEDSNEAPAVTLGLSSDALPGSVVVPGEPVAEAGDSKARYLAAGTSSVAVLLPEGDFSWGASPAWLQARFESPQVALGLGSMREVLTRGLAREGRAAFSVAGHVSPAPSGQGVVVVGLSAEGRTSGWAPVGEDGAFALVSLEPITRAFVAVSGLRAGEVVEVAADAADVKLSLRSLARLRVQILDHDSRRALPARLVVHGRDGTPEPNFGPPHRATGAGPLIDAEHGEVDVMLPAGSYRLLGARGVEYSMAKRDITLRAGDDRREVLGLRHVVDSPGWAGCDLHVHSRGSFDSPVSLEDRVRTLMAAGIDFAVPSEHNSVGSYESSEVVAQQDWMGWVPAVEVTTSGPQRGHFNVFPYSLMEVPRYDHTSLRELVAFVRKKSAESVIQINHPRMGKIGHFTTLRLDPNTTRGLTRLAAGFDTIEVYNGQELGWPARTEEVISDWIQLFERGRRHWGTGSSDSHLVQYTTAGYPRTFVAVRDDHEDGQGAPLDVPGLLASLKRGHAFVTSGPFVELSQDGRGPGERLVVAEGKAKIHVKVRAAPWVSVNELEVRVGGNTVLRRPLTSPALQVEMPEGTLEQVRRAAVRLDEDIEVPVPAGTRTLVVLVRGGQSIGEVLPFMDFKPLAVVNPMLVE